MDILALSFAMLTLISIDGADSVLYTNSPDIYYGDTNYYGPSDDHLTDQYDELHHPDDESMRALADFKKEDRHKNVATSTPKVMDKNMFNGFRNPESFYYNDRLNPTMPTVGNTSPPKYTRNTNGHNFDKNVTTGRFSNFQSKENENGVSHYYEGDYDARGIGSLSNGIDNGLTDSDPEFIEPVTSRDTESEIFNGGSKSTETVVSSLDEKNSSFENNKDNKKWSVQLDQQNRDGPEKDEDAYVNSNRSFCDIHTHMGCDLAGFERCDAHTRTCRCLRGYLRPGDDMIFGVCKAVTYFQTELSLRLPHSEFTLNEREAQTVKDKVMQLLSQALLSEIQGHVMSLKVKMVSQENGQTTFTFELALDRELILASNELMSALGQRLRILTRQQTFLPDLMTGGGVTGSFSPFIELNHCLMSQYNFCHENAECSEEGDNVINCQCREGYNDVSPDRLRAAGEICEGSVTKQTRVTSFTKAIEECLCHNGGICIDGGNGRKCSCLNWYFGTDCEIDGKELILICGCTLGSLLVIGLLFCCCYCLCNRHKERSNSQTLFTYSPDTSVMKLPRVWMDSNPSHHEKEVAPRDFRRLSMTSAEGNPYFDGFIIEDVPITTLPRRDRSSSYHQPTMPRGPATVSSHSFYKYG